MRIKNLAIDPQVQGKGRFIFAACRALARSTLCCEPSASGLSIIRLR